MLHSGIEPWLRRGRAWATLDRDTLVLRRAFRTPIPLPGKDAQTRMGRPASPRVMFSLLAATRVEQAALDAGGRRCRARSVSRRMLVPHIRTDRARISDALS